MAETEQAEGGSGFAIHPMDQFVPRKLFCTDDHGTPFNECTVNIHWYDVTNITLWMAVAVLIVAALMMLGTRRRAIVPSRSQSVAELRSHCHP